MNFLLRFGRAVAKLIAKHYAEILRNALVMRNSAHGLPMPDFNFKSATRTRWAVQAKLAGVMKFLQSA
jgi:hypothetical protein